MKVQPSPDFDQWALFQDPETNVWYEARYIVTQSVDEGPEYIEIRRFNHQDDPWIKMDNEDDLGPEMDKALEDFFFPKADIYIEDTVTDVLPSTKSDIERIDKALKLLGELCGANKSLTWTSAEVIFDALHDAKSGLLYLSKSKPKPQD